jgi:hypothetical protein
MEGGRRTPERCRHWDDLKGKRKWSAQSVKAAQSAHSAQEYNLPII